MTAVRRLTQNPLVTRLVIATLLINLAVAALAVANLYSSYAKTERRAVISTQNFSQVLAQDLSAGFARMDLAVLAVKEEIETRFNGRNADATWMNAFIERQHSRQPNLGALRVADSEGRVIVGTEVSPDKQVNMAFRKYFQELRDSPRDDLVISTPAVGQISGKWSITLARRINTSEGEFGGIAFGVVFLEQFKKAFASIDLGPHGVVSLRDLDLGTVVRYPEPTSMGTAVGNRTFSKEWPEKLRENPDYGSYFAVGLDGLNRALSYQRVAGFPFYVIVGQYPADYLAEWTEQAIYTAMLVSVFALVTCWLAWMVSSAWRKQEVEVRLREADRERMLLELHDGCIQSIYAIGLQLENSRQLVPGAPQKAIASLADAMANLNLVIQDLRAFIAGERPQPYTGAGFMSEIERMLPPGGADGPEFTVNVDQSIVPMLKPDQAMHLLRIARESISNIVKHSSASNARLSLQRRGAALHLEVRDNGVGIGEIRSGEGLGLHHITARARKLGGSARLQSVPKQGTLITVEFPLAA